MKYRCLTYQEFDLLKDDFKEYLYSQRLSSYEWSVLQDQNSIDAQHLLETYSDLTFDKVFKDINYLEIRSTKELNIIQFNQNCYITIGIKVPSFSSIDLTNADSLSDLNDLDLNGYRSFKKKSEYSSNREGLIFNLIEKGAYVVDSNSFDFLQLVRQSYQN